MQIFEDNWKVLEFRMTLIGSKVSVLFAAWNICIVSIILEHLPWQSKRIALAL